MFKKKKSQIIDLIFIMKTEKIEREWLRKMAKDLKTTEVQIQLANEDTKRLESVVEEKMDVEDK